MKKIGPFSIARVLGDNVYEVALPQDSRMHCVFSVEHLYPFHGDIIPPIPICYDPSWTSPLLSNKVDIVLDYQGSKFPMIVNKYYIKWKK